MLSVALFSGRKARSWFARNRFIVILALVAIAARALLSTSFAQILGKTDLNVERRGHTATELPSGKILIVGGENANGLVGASESSIPPSAVPPPVARSAAAPTPT